MTIHAADLRTRLFSPQLTNRTLMAKPAKSPFKLLLWGAFLMALYSGYKWLRWQGGRPLARSVMVLAQNIVPKAEAFQVRLTLSDVLLQNGEKPTTLVKVSLRDITSKPLATQHKLENLVVGTPSEWFDLDPLRFGVGGRIDVQVFPYKAQRVKSMKVTVEVRPTNAPTQIQTLSAPSDGPRISLTRRTSQDGKTTLGSGVELYKKALNQAQAVAVADKDRPRRLLVADGVTGMGALPEALDDATQMLMDLGINTVQFNGWNLSEDVIGNKARASGLSRWRKAIFKPPTYYGWNITHGPQKPDEWAEKIAKNSQTNGMAPAQMALFHLADEPGWSFPDVWESNVVKDADRLRAFHEYLQAQGLKPADIGAADWNSVRPIGASQAKDLPSRRLFYWSARYPSDGAAEGFRLWSEALRRRFGAQLRTTSNWNNRVSRFYRPSPNRKAGNNANSGPDAAMGSLDWMAAGRARAVGYLWTEDWFGDGQAQNWSYYADVLRCAAREGNDSPLAQTAPNPDGLQPVEFGGYIVGRTLGTHPAAGPMRALALVGHGAKAVEWYTFGPEELFPDNGYSNNANAYRAIADGNRLLGRAEELLYPGRRATARIAVLVPGSAQVWDKAPELPMYQREVAGLHFALTHSQYPVDFLDETAVANGALQKYNYALFYVTAPNVSAKAQTLLSEWINQGGTAVFSPGAAAADEYNTPTNLLDKARGLVSSPQPRPLAGVQRAVDVDDPSGEGYAATQSAAVTLKFADAKWGSNAEFSSPMAPLKLTSSTSLADFANGASAISRQTFGRGAAISYGFWPAQAYLNSAQAAAKNSLPQGWNAALRDIVTAPARLTNIVRPVDLSVPVVEATRLDSPQGSAITLLNWTGTPQNNLTVLVRGAARYSKISSAQGATLKSTPLGADLQVTMPLQYADVLLLRP